MKKYLAFAGLTAVLLSGCETMKDYTKVPDFMRKGDVVTKDKYVPNDRGRSLYPTGGQNVAEMANASLRRSHPYTGQNSMEIMVMPPGNLVDGQYATSPIISHEGTMAMSNIVTEMTEGTSIHVPVSHASFCADEQSGIPRFVIETQVSHYDQYVRNLTRGPSLTYEEGGYTGDGAYGSEGTRDSFYINGRIIACDKTERMTVRNMKVEVQSYRHDQSVLIFAKAMGITVRRTSSETPGLNNAVMIVSDALLSDLMIKHAKKYPANTNAAGSWSIPPAVQYRSRATKRPQSNAPTPQRSYAEDQVVSWGQKTELSKSEYFPAYLARTFDCRFGRVNSCNMEFDLPSRGAVSDYRYYLSQAVQNAGAPNSTVTCGRLRRDKVKCSIKGDLASLNPIQMRKGLYGK